MIVGILTIIVAAIAVFNHHLAWLLAIFPGLYILYAFFIAYSRAPELNDGIWHDLTSTEKMVWKRYHAAIRFSMAAPATSRTVTLLQILSVITGIAFMITGFYWGGLLILGWFIFGLITPKLNPILYLSDHAKRGNIEAEVELDALKSLYDKLQDGSRQNTPSKVSDDTKSTGHARGWGDIE